MDSKTSQNQKYLEQLKLELDSKAYESEHVCHSVFTNAFNFSVKEIEAEESLERYLAKRGNPCRKSYNTIDWNY